MDVSIVVPLYNEQDSIRLLYSAITSAVASKFPDYEIIFVDDGSNEVPELVQLVQEAEFHAGCALDANCAVAGGGPERQLDLAIGKYERAQELGAGSARFLAFNFSCAMIVCFLHSGRSL